MDISTKNIFLSFRIPLMVAIYGYHVTAQTCSPTECGSPPLNSNTTYVPLKTCYTNGDRVDYLCAGDLGGPPYNLCASGIWSLPPPTCEVFTCNRPAVDDNVNIEPFNETYAARETITYSCEDGSELIGSTTATCDSQNTWTPPTVPLCVSVCRNPEIENGQVIPVNSAAREGDSAKVTCDTGYSISPGSSSVIVCLANGTWNQIPQCYESCTMSAVPNSDYQDDGVTINHAATVTVSCLSGCSFNQNTVIVITCSDGTLESSVGEVPDACYAYCPIPEIPNGHLTPANVTFMEGGEALVTCGAGYELAESSDIISCQSNGTWTRIPRCIAVCDPLPTVSNGMVTSSNGTLTEGALAFIYCDEGYSPHPASSSIIACQEDGSWDQPPSCVGICPAPEIPNGHLTPANVTFKEEDEAFVTCGAGYTLEEASPTISCQRNGSWTRIPRCVALCPAPVIDNGHLKPTNATFKEGDEALVTCDAGYTIKDDMSPKVTCQNNGNFTKVPKCHPTTCNVAPVENSNTFRGVTVNHGENYTITCNYGYSYNERTTFQVYCMYGDLGPDGATLPEACFRNCSTRMPPSNGDVTPGRLHGQTVEYSCDAGFVLEGPPSSACNDGQWEPGRPPSCKAFCTVPPVDNSNYPHGANVTDDLTLECDEGFSFNQSVSFTVECVDGHLSPRTTFPDACYKDCSVRLIGPPNGDVSEGNLHGVTLEYSCNAGYLLDGPPTTTCIDGRWSPFRLPTCLVMCSIPNVENGQIIPTNVTFTEGDMATVQCDEGFIIADWSSPTLLCLDDGHWDHAAYCIAVCPIPVIENGKVSPVDTTFTEGDQIDVSCDEGYSLKDDLNSPPMCLSNGTWDRVPRCIQNAVCEVPKIPNSNFAEGGTLEDGDSVLIRCNIGFSYDQMARFRVSCDQGELLPTTVIPDTCHLNCMPRMSPDNGHVSMNFRHGSVAEYSCDDGYDLKGPSSSTCFNGIWIPIIIPSCVPATPDQKVSLHCRENIFRVVIPGNLLIDQDVTSLHLRDESCVGKFDDNGHFIIESHYDTCGTTQEIDESNDQVIYRNLVTDRPTDGYIDSRSSSVNIEAECVFDRTNFMSTHYRLVNPLNQPVSGEGRYNFTFLMYTDETFSDVRETPVYVQPNSEIYVKAQLETDVTGISLTGSRCWATPTENPDDETFMDLIVDGCASRPNDVVVRYNLLPGGKPFIAFSAKVLQFRGEDKAYIHCNTIICEKTSPWACLPSCGNNRREKRASRLMTSYRVSQGPIVQAKKESRSDASQPEMSSLIVFTVFAVLIIVGIFLVALSRKRRLPTKPESFVLQNQDL